MSVVRFPGHHWARCRSSDACAGCCICEGGLASCTVCGGAEASLTTDCPGRPMGSQHADLVQAGRINYQDGAWRREDAARIPMKRRRR